MSVSIYAKRTIGLIIGLICSVLLLETPIYAFAAEYDTTDSGRVLLNPITVYIIEPLAELLSEVNFPAPGGGEALWVRQGRSCSRRRG